MCSIDQTIAQLEIDVVEDVVEEDLFQWIISPSY